MNIYTAMSDKEVEEATKLQDLIKSVVSASEDMSRVLDYRFEVRFAGVGQTTHFVCEELGINKNITDYNCW
jgi:hypothetical protein